MSVVVRLLAGLLAGVVLLVGPVGCGSEPPSPPEEEFVNWPAALNDFRFRWEAEPGIDLVSGPAVPLRAYLESFRIAELTKDSGAVYPGFERAVPQPLPAPYDSLTPAELVALRPSMDAEPFGPVGPFYGNEFFRVMELAPIQGGYRAYVCDAFYKLFRPAEERGKFVSVLRYDSRTGLSAVGGLRVWRVEFTDTPPTAGAPAAVTTVQRGGAPAPMGDVFGPWRITGASDFNWGGLSTRTSNADETVDGAQRLSRCSQRLRDSREMRETLTDKDFDAPPETEPADPGWPDSSE